MNNIKKISKPSRVILSSIMMMSIIGVTMEGENMINTSYAATAKTSASVKYVKTTGNYTNIRSSCTTKENNIKGKLHSGVTGKVIGRTTHWYKITTGRVTGYVHASAVKSANNSSDVKANDCTAYRITTSNLNIRDAAGANVGNVIGSIPAGTEVTTTKIMRYSNSVWWYKISYKGTIGWIHGAYTKANTNQEAPEQDTTGVEHKADMVVTAPSGLNVRKTANAKSSKVGFMGHNRLVKVTRLAPKGQNGRTDNWYYIPEFRGWAIGKYLKTQGQVRSAEEKIINVAIKKADTSKIATNKESTLNLISSADASKVSKGIIQEDTYLIAENKWSAEKLLLLNEGTDVKVVSTDANWTKVEFNGQAGYVSNDYVDVSSVGEDKTYEVHMMSELTNEKGSRLDKVIVNIPGTEIDIITQLENDDMVKLELVQERNNFRIKGSSVISEDVAAEIVPTLSCFTIEDANAKVYESVDGQMKEVAYTLNQKELVTVLENEPESEFIKVMFEDGGVGFVKKNVLG